MRIRYAFSMALLCAVSICLNACLDSANYAPEPYVRPLEIVKLSDKEFLHISYLKNNKGGYIPCNGYVRIEGNQAIVFDTPFNDSISRQLITYIQEDLNAAIKAVVLSHWHIDAAGGIGAFKEAGISSYATVHTAEKLGDAIEISHTIIDSVNLSLGTVTVESRYFGHAHSQGDLFSYISQDSLLFGGCAIKALGGSKGNLADANPQEWGHTIVKVTEKYPSVKRVIPGHGAPGTGELLEYTKSIFTEDLQE